jgi:hypothetical protein
MLIRIDTREHDLIRQVTHLIANIPIFNKIIMKTETLPIGDIIIGDEKECTHDQIINSFENFVIIKKKQIELNK